MSNKQTQTYKYLKSRQIICRFSLVKLRYNRLNCSLPKQRNRWNKSETISKDQSKYKNYITYVNYGDSEVEFENWKTLILLCNFCIPG